jgi:hypothetical protein
VNFTFRKIIARLSVWWPAKECHDLTYLDKDNFPFVTAKVDNKFFTSFFKIKKTVPCD